MSISLTWTGQKENLLSLGDYFSEIYFPSPAFTIFLVNEESDQWSASVYFENEPDEKILTDIYNFAKDDYDLDVPVKEDLLADDWVKVSLQGLGKVETNQFAIIGSHDLSEITENKTPIIIDANQAFGTGHHPTTIGCIYLLEWLKKNNFQFKNIWDVGCGSAILSIACAKLWDSKIIASDIDELSVEIAEINCKKNGCPDIVTLHADGCDDEMIKSSATYDLIVANILAEPLIEIAKDVFDNLGSDGYYIMSGIMEYQRERVIKHYKSVGFELVDCGLSLHPTWPSLLWKKN